MEAWDHKNCLSMRSEYFFSFEDGHNLDPDFVSRSYLAIHDTDCIAKCN